MPNFKYEPEMTLESSEYKIMWDRSVITDKHILANRTDIILINKTDKITYLVDIIIIIIIIIIIYS
jgi:hypothetical protein